MPKKKPENWTTDEALRKLFPKPVAEALKRAAHDASPKKKPGDERREKPGLPGKSPHSP
jgi:hypothetical protein